jgi:hypothetical protein
MKIVVGTLALASVVLGRALSLAGHAEQPRNDGPKYVNRTNLVRSPDYREWMFLSSGLGMTVLATWVLLIGAVMARLERRLLRWKPEFAEARWERLA